MNSTTGTKTIINVREKAKYFATPLLHRLNGARKSALNRIASKATKKFRAIRIVVYRMANKAGNGGPFLSAAAVLALNQYISGA